MKNKILKIFSFILAIIMSIIITASCGADKSNLTVISEETGAFSEIETEEKTTEVTTVGLTEKEISLTTVKESTTSSVSKSKEVTVT